MRALDPSLRDLLRKAVVDARPIAERASHTALVAAGVDEPRPPKHLDEDARALRKALVAATAQVGGKKQLAAEVAYEHWHRMLFARFLAESQLLMHPEWGVAVSLAECRELAHEAGTDVWSLAEQYAAKMLPGIFRPEDPLLRLRLPPESRAKLERIVEALPPDVFTADDALGWIYQFWQTEAKRQVNLAERKIGGADLAPVTQLFTEHYMVGFLLHNTVGSWWAGRNPDSTLVKQLEYLRRDQQGVPVVGTFDGWPDDPAALTLLDPCCGSGHFLVTAFHVLLQIRMEASGTDAAAAGDAVLRENLFGLELDARCTQLAAFNLALAAWKTGGYRPLPDVNIACSGISLRGSREDWQQLAQGDTRVEDALTQLHRLFMNAPDLGSLIDPGRELGEATLLSADLREIQPLLAQALEREADDPALAVFGTAAVGVARAAELLARTYTLVATNVPYLKRGSHTDTLKEYADRRHAEGKADLATMFVERCRTFTAPGGTHALVTPQAWLTLTSYEGLRRRLLSEQTWHLAARLGPGAFETITGEVVQPALTVMTDESPEAAHDFGALDVSALSGAAAKAEGLQSSGLITRRQVEQLRNPDSRVVLEDVVAGVLLSEYAAGLQGIATADYARFGRCFWELAMPADGWEYQQSTVPVTTPYGGREHMVLWEDGKGVLARSRQARIQGRAAWGKQGIAVSQMGSLPVTLYTGELFDNNTAVIVPKDPANVAAIWAFCSSPEFNEAVRRIDQKMNVTNATLVKVSFDLARWQAVADRAGDLPPPHSDDPTQWLFHGGPATSTDPLQTAVARLVGYRWPQQESDDLDDLADADGIVPLQAGAGEQSAAERLRALLARAYGDTWSQELHDTLLADAGFAGRSLAEWLRDRFFADHCQLFHQRPFVWHVTDGLRDGFAALVHYHRLDRQLLEKLIYQVLGSWIATQQDEAARGKDRADARLLAAQQLRVRLAAILEGEDPYDIYVRWKPIEHHPIGWQPDLNDGVRLNIRPFMEAHVLRSKPKISWKKDPGRDPNGKDRTNEDHFTVAEKRAARLEAAT